jgi:exo-1,4-beta-D-glucosaminidase
MVLLSIVCFVLWGCDDNGGKGEDVDAGDSVPPVEEIAPTIYLTSFEMQSSLVAPDTGATISTPAYVPQAWYPAEVPTTVLRALVANGVYPDPRIGLNNMLIPDSNDEFNTEYNLLQHSHIPGQNPWRSPYHFRTVFQLPAADYEGKQVWLNFNGINYKADVFLNGAQIASSADMAGMFGSFKYNVTAEALVGQDNVLSVTIHPVDNPGTPSHAPLEPLGGAGDNCGTDSGIAMDVTMHCSLGWDWIPVIRDRSMGIWQDVFVNATETVDVKDSNVKATFPATGLAPVTLSVETTLANPTAQKVTGTLTAEIAPANFQGGAPVTVSQNIELNANSETPVSFLADQFPALVFADPQLWWPHQYGAPNLYALRITFSVDNTLSDVEVRRFGIRKIETTVDEFAIDDDANIRRTFWINDQRVVLRGGSWVPEMLLQRDRDRLEKELRFLKEANLNTVRLWGGGVTPPEAFFDIADELGMLVWSDFWITGDGQGTWDQGSRDYPLDGALFLRHADNVIKRIRHHASLFVWNGGNEGYSRAEIYNSLRAMIIDLDGTRPFLPSTGWSTSIPADLLEWSYPDGYGAGTYSGAPYIWVPLREYFTLAHNQGDWLMNNEVGIPSVPRIRSIRKFIDNFQPDPDPASDDLFPLNSTWAYHDAADAEWGNPTFSRYHGAIYERYGTPETLEAYVSQAQVITANSLKSMFEAVNSQLERNSGILLWKANGAWPSMLWQIYDWYLRPVAGYYWLKKANALLRVQYDSYLNVIRVSNRTTAPVTGLTVEMQLYDQDLQLISTETSPPLTIPPETTEDAFVDFVLPEMAQVPDPNAPPPDPAEPEPAEPTKAGMAFLKLIAKDAAGALLTDNFYWLQADDDFTALRDLPPVDLTVTAQGAVDPATGEYRVTADVTNASESLVFFTKLLLLNGPGGEEVLPTYWSDNFFILMPGESKSVTANVRAEQQPATPVLALEGWNTVSKEIPL